MSNIYDIAKIAGVSAATVSKVLNGYPDVSEKTREKIRKIAKDLEYYPSAVARGLAKKQSMTIGVFFRDHMNSGWRHPFFHDVLASFKDVVGESGYDLLFFANTNLEDLDYEAKARNRDVDGLLLVGVPRTEMMTSKPGKSPALSSLAQSEMPCVSVDLDMLGKRSSYLCSDNIGGAEQAMDYLVECGHRKIGFVGDRFSTLPGHDRMLGYHRGLSKHGLPLRSEWVTEGDFTEVGGYQATVRILAQTEIPTAIFFAGDMMAIGGMTAMREAGLKPGEDISVVGFDDITFAKFLTPGLTTVRQNREKMGRMAGVELISLIENRTQVPRVISVETELVIRDTVARIDGSQL